MYFEKIKWSLSLPISYTPPAASGDPCAAPRRSAAYPKPKRDMLISYARETWRNGHLGSLTSITALGQDSELTLSQSQIVLATPIYFSTKGTIISKHKRRDQSPGAIERSTSQGA